MPPNNSFSTVGLAQLVRASVMYHPGEAENIAPDGGPGSDVMD